MRTGIFTPPAAMNNMQALIQTAEAGFHAFEPFAAYELTNPDKSAAAALREEAEKLGIEIPCLSVGIDVTAEDAVEMLMGYADCAAAMGAGYLHHTIYPYLDPAQMPSDFEALLKRAADAARKVYDYAAGIGVGCIYEDQGLVFNGVERYARFYQELDRPAGVVLDVGNIAFVGEDADAFAEAFKDRIVHVHVKDYMKVPIPAEGDFRLPDGTGLALADLLDGDMRIRESLDILNTAGFNGCCMLECSPITDGYAEQRRNMERLEALLK